MDPTVVSESLVEMGGIPGYRIQRLIDSGGMGGVYLAADENLKRLVAIKVIHPQYTDQPDYVERFTREAEIVAAFQHPNIVTVYSSGWLAKKQYIVMEYIAGGTLAKRMEAQRLEESEATSIGIQMADALAYAHKRGIIHRDFKPANVLVRENGSPVLSDFGIAKAEMAVGTKTETGIVIGNMRYMAPEQALGQPISNCVDIYSFGLVLHEMLTGALPKRHPVRNKGDASEVMRAVPSALGVIISRCLNVNPGARPTARECHEWLESRVSRRSGGSWHSRMAQDLRSAFRPLVLLAILAVVAILAYKPLNRYWATQESAYQPSDPEIKRLLHRDPANPVQPSVGERSIAVLAFVDMSEKRDQEYFSDGLSEELINQLSRIPDIQVISQTSSFYFKGKPTMIADIAKQLGVKYVLEGSVRRNRNAIRVNAQLIRADNGSDVWSDSYNRDVKDVFEVQGDIAAAVVHALKAKLIRTEPMSSHRTANTEAYQEYLIGLKFRGRSNVDDWGRAAAAFRRAIELDPNYAAAYAAVVRPEALLADLKGDTAAGIPQAEADAQKAIELAPDEADGYAARAYIRQTWNWDWAGAQADYTKVLTLEPTDARSLSEYGLLLADLGRFSEALAALRKSVQYDPLAVDVWHNLGRLQMYQGDFPTAHEAYHRCLELEPDSEACIFNFGILELLEGNAPAAKTTFTQLKDPGIRLPGMVMVEHTLGHAKASQDALHTLVSEQAQGNDYQIAETYAWIGEKDKALDWLERAYDARDGGLPEIKGDLLLASLRADPRYKAIIRKMHLPP